GPGDEQGETAGRARNPARGGRPGPGLRGAAVRGRGAVRTARRERMNERTRLTRWRLVLGAGAEEALGCPLEGGWAERDQTLSFLYDREYRAGRNVRPSGERTGGLGQSQLLVPEWINAVHTLFPKRTIERIEKDALERYQLEELVTNPELLQRAQP